MRIVIDTNRIIAALVKSSTTRSIIFHHTLEFFTPDYTLQEIENHKEELKIKAGLTSEEFDLVIALIFQQIKIIQKETYDKYMNDCREEMPDQGDVPILATAIALNVDAIWSHDPHFLKQKRVKVVTNSDVLHIINERT